MAERLYIQPAEIINRLVRQFGANHIEFIAVGSRMIQFTTPSRHRASVYVNHEAMVVLETDGEHGRVTQWSRWIEAIIEGKKRGDDGSIID